MALVVEDGTGLATADSYVSIAELDAYHSLYGNTAWAAALGPAKEIAARKAAQYISAVYGTRWTGARIEALMSLHWPRSGVYDSDGYAYDDDVVPQRVKDAQCELALSALTEDLLPDLANPGTIASESNKIGPLEESISYVGGKSQIKRYRKADLLLRGLISSSDTVLRA